MSKASIMQRVSERQKVMIVGLVAVLLFIVNVLPLHHSSHGSCAGGITFTTTSESLGVPMAYYQTSQNNSGDNCLFSSDQASSRNFSAQALLTDALVFGIIMVGLNVVLDRRTK